MNTAIEKTETKREEFLEIMDEIIPWDEWVTFIEPNYPIGKRGRPPRGLKRYCGYICCNAPDATTLLKSWHLLEENNLYKAFFDAINRVLVASGHIMKGGTIVDATIINAPSSNKNAEKGYAPEVHRTKMGNEWRLVMNAMLP